MFCDFENYENPKTLVLGFHKLETNQKTYVLVILKNPKHPKTFVLSFWNRKNPKTFVFGFSKIVNILKIMFLGF